MPRPVPEKRIPDLNPAQVKQREHIGISAMVSGALFILAGFVVLFISWPAATMALLLGMAILIAGGIILARIPDLLHTPEEEST